MTTLPNGLQVVYLEDHSTPIVHAAIWYHVGSKNEKPGRTGFAHLFEHLMFKGSRNVRPDAHPSWITSIGGQANAFTDEDATVYWETVPAQYLPLVLWLEADRMASLEVTADKFKTEVEVVQEERRMRVENQPFGRLPEIIFDKAFTTHPYKHQTIGSIEDLRGGDHQRSAGVPRHVLRAQQRDARAGRGLRDEAGAGAGRPVSRPACRGEAGAARHSQGAGAEVHQGIHGDRDRGRCRPLSCRTTSRMTGIRMPTRCTSWPRFCRTATVRGFTARWCTRSRWRLPRSARRSSSSIPNLFYAVAIVQQGNRPEAVLKELQAQLDKVKTEGVTAAELNRAKRQFARDYILGPRDACSRRRCTWRMPS